jgi:antitoxin ChpS
MSGKNIPKAVLEKPLDARSYVMSENPKRKETEKPRYTLDELLAQSDFAAPRTEEEQAWLDMAPVGREFGSAEFDELERQAEAQSSAMPDGSEPESSVNHAIGKRGSLFFFSETGTEGGHWAFMKEGTRSYEGMHLFGDGDHLKVFNADGSVRWEGVIQLQSYPPFQESADNRWIHSDQVGVERQFWAEMFFEELKAELAGSAAGGPDE